MGTTVCPLIPCLLSKLVQVETGMTFPVVNYVCINSIKLPGNRKLKKCVLVDSVSDSEVYVTPPFF